MAELVDAPDSKSGHFGGVGSIPSTPTNKIIKKTEIQKFSQVRQNKIHNLVAFCIIIFVDKNLI